MREGKDIKQSQATDRDKLALIKQIVKKMRPIVCPDWEIRCALSDLDKESAQCKMHYAERSAVIIVANDTPYEDIPQNVGHELMHLALADYDRMASEYVMLKSSREDMDYIDGVFGNILERTVDSLAKGIVTSLGYKAGTIGWLGL